MGRLVILSGPSCAGKGPLYAALERFHPELVAPLHKVCLYNTRAPRPGERDGVDYHFRTREEIEALREDDGYVVMDVRGDLQALDLAGLRRRLETGSAFFEGNPFVGVALLELPDVPKVSAFLAPLSRDELVYLQAPERRVDLQSFVTDVMRRKLLRRTTRQKGVLAKTDLENIERRAGSALRELSEAWRFDYVLPNHDGEDSENWDAFYYPVGDARKAFTDFALILRGEEPRYAEKWEEGLLD